MKKDLRFLAASVFLLFCLTVTRAAYAQNTIHVPADQPTIQAAISAAQPGDTVLVAPGTYIENLDFQGKAITVTSSDGPSVTIVDGGAAGPVVTFDTNEGANSVLSGFTLQNGVPSQIFPVTGTQGGGVLILNASPTITNNVITGNHAICGIGIESRGGSAVIRGNTITNNSQAGGTGGCGGGGIEVTNGSPQIIGNTITSNSLPGGGFGGGINVSGASPIIRNNTISGNSVWNSGGGINLQAGGAPVVVQNIIVGNSTNAGGSGAGISIQGPSSSAYVVVNNTIAGNTARDGSSGIYANVLSPVVISNNIVVVASGQTAIVCDPSRSTFPAFSHNDAVVTGSTALAWSSNCAAFASSNGNISVDPQFVNTAGNDYHLQAGSPAIDAGDNTAPDLPQQDYDGNPRIAPGCATGCTSTIDLGVYEFVAPNAPSATLSPSSLGFGSVLVGSTSAAQTVSLSNPGPQSLLISGISVSGDFAQTSNCPASLGPGTSCLINVTFSPAASGLRTGALVVSSNSIPATPVVSLSGTGLQPAISVSPASISFGNQVLNTNTTNQAVTVTNTGNATLTVSAVSISGDPDLFVAGNNCGSEAPGASCTIQVGFTPRSAGPASATLSITSDAPTSPSVALSGNGINPIASLSPSSLDFGNQLVNTASSAQTITLSNTGTDPLQIQSITVTGDFSQSNSCPVAPAGMNAGTSCSIQVVFKPTATGVRSGSLTVSSNSAQPVLPVSLSGTGTQPAISVSPASVNFGGQSINTSAPDQTITVTNTGSATLLISSTLVSGDPDLNVILNNCTAAVPPAGSCSIEVGFTPRSTGAASATLSIGSNAPTTPTTVALSGTGIDPVGSLSPSGLNFGNQQLNTGSAAQTVTLSNTGTDPLSISGISVSGDFTQTNTCPASLAVGSSCAIQVTFHPTAIGTRSGSLSVSSNSSPPVVSDFVTGTGVNPAISVSPTSIAFGDTVLNTDAPAQTITVSNPGTTTLHVNSLTMAGDPDFFTLSNNCVGGTGVAPGGSCSIQVEFAPKSAGAGSATLTISSDASTSPTTVALSGNGINPALGSVSPSSLSFANQLVNTTSAVQTITVSSTGTGPLQINSINVSGDFAQSNNCPVAPAGMTAGSSCTIQVVFQPAATGPRSGSLIISSNSAQPLPAVSLSGTGVDYAVSASPSSVSVQTGHQAKTTVTVSALGGSFNNSVALSCGNLPSGATCSFSPSSVVPGASSASSSLTINTQQSGGIKTPVGTYSITVNGSSSVAVRSTVLTLTVTR